MSKKNDNDKYSDDNYEHEHGKHKHHKKHNHEHKECKEYNRTNLLNPDCEVKWHIIKGDKGDKGDKGCKGDKGDRGERGERGCMGERGKRGYQGDKGELGPRGERGKCGKTGYMGPTGPRGESTVSGYAFGTNINQNISVGDQSPVYFNNTDFPNHNVTVTGTNVTVYKPGTYQIDYFVKGTPVDTTVPMKFDLYASGTGTTTSLYGSVFSSVFNGQSTVNGSLQATFPDPLHNVFSGTGTTLQLRNISGTPVNLSGDNSTNSNIRLMRIY